MARKALLALALIASGCSQRQKIVVGSKNFTEQLVLGEIIAQHLEKRLGIEVERKLNLGGTMLAHQALVSGAIDLYPEYSGTALKAVLHGPVGMDVAAEYQKRWNLHWLRPLGFNNTFAMVVNKSETANTLSQASTKEWRLGAGYEFISRDDGMPGLIRAYGLHLAGAPVTMDLGLLYSALTRGQVDMVAASSTDGMLSVLGVKQLKDDKGYFPSYECAIVTRDGLSPKVVQALEELSGKISEEKMQKLNYAVDGEHKSPADVAKAANIP